MKTLFLLKLTIFMLLNHIAPAQTKSPNVMNNSTYTMTITQTFNAPLEKVWTAFTDAESIKRWWGPVGFTAPIANINFREGNVSLVCMRSPDGFEIFNTWTYQKISAMKSIEFIQHFTDKSGKKIKPSDIGMPPGIPDEVPHIITFKKIGDQKTELTIVEHGYTNPQIVEISKNGTASMLQKFATEVER
ncbi:SRPBCC family protein [Pseudochryseolinea flava]|nr:SRPBCC domain-containing protein [Pseudochryseolinea flava]